MKRSPIQQMREELLALVNNYFDRAEARIKQQEKKLQQQPPKAPEPTASTQPHLSKVVMNNEHSPANSQAADPELETFFASISNK